MARSIFGELHQTFKRTKQRVKRARARSRAKNQAALAEAKIQAKRDAEVRKASRTTVGELRASGGWEFANGTGLDDKTVVEPVWSTRDNQWEYIPVTGRAQRAPGGSSSGGRSRRPAQEITHPAPKCGKRTDDGTPCERRGRCPHHHPQVSRKTDQPAAPARATSPAGPAMPAGPGAGASKPAPARAAGAGTAGAKKPASARPTKSAGRKRAQTPVEVWTGEGDDAHRIDGLPAHWLESEQSAEALCNWYNKSAPENAKVYVMSGVEKPRTQTGPRNIATDGAKVDIQIGSVMGAESSTDADLGDWDQSFNGSVYNIATGNVQVGQQVHHIDGPINIDMGKGFPFGTDTDSKD